MASSVFNNVAAGGAVLMGAAGRGSGLGRSGKKKPPIPKHDGSDKPPILGQEMQDGSIYAGTTSIEGRSHDVYVMPHDIQKGRLRKKREYLTYDEAEAAVDKLNKKKALGHDDWQIPDPDTLERIEKRQHEGGLSGTFNGVGSFKPDGRYAHSLYWTTPELASRGRKAIPRAVAFDDGRTRLLADADKPLPLRAVRFETLKS